MDTKTEDERDSKTYTQTVSSKTKIFNSDHLTPDPILITIKRSGFSSALGKYIKPWLQN